MKPFEIIDHTADVGLRIYGRNLHELFHHAALGFFHIVTEPSQITSSPEHSLTIHLAASKVDELLLKWLRELLYHFDAKKFMALKYNFQLLSETEIQAELKGCLFDPAVHEQKVEIKAVTYHGFKLVKKGKGWIAEVLFDI